MRLIYLDESGVEELSAEPSHFVLLGVMVPDNQWKNITVNIERVKGKYGLADEEIHTAWMARRYSVQDAVPAFESLPPIDRKAQATKAISQRAAVLGVSAGKDKIKGYRREVAAIRPYLHLTHQERRQCLTDLAKELASHTDLRIFADAISKKDFTNGVHTSPYEMAFEQVISRSQHYLHNAANDLGMIIIDNNEKAALRLTKMARAFHTAGTFYNKIPNIVETPLFVNSALTSMIQMADLCAYGLRRFVENDETWIWDLVKARADRSPIGKLVGIRHFTGKRKCTCEICQEHGRPK
jgi:hypothetical protein